MTLRCSVGDMAIIIKSMAGNEGKMVTCVRLSQPHSMYGYAESFCTQYAGRIWEVDRYLCLSNGSRKILTRGYVPDDWLLPIKPKDKEKEEVKDKELENV